MKKILISALISLTAVLSAQPAGATYLFSPDNDGYWLNRFRGYKKYPVHFYQDYMLKSGAGESTSSVETHDYQRGVAVTARTGQRMYDSSTYTVTVKTGGEQYRAVTDGTFYASQTEVKIKKGHVFTPLGEVKVNGRYYILFELPDGPFVIAADEDGNVLDSIGVIDNGNFYISRDITLIRPENFKVEPYTDVKKQESDPVLNFEIKYGGIRNGQIIFTVADGQGGTQDQAVPFGGKFVQVNGINFEIIYASPEYIEYKIM